MLEEAVTRDPNFVLAYCELARWHDEFSSFKAVPLRRSRRSTTEASPRTPWRRRAGCSPIPATVHLALARHAVNTTYNIEEADTQIQLARQTLFNNAELETFAGRVDRRQDQMGRSCPTIMERAISLEPRDYLLRNLLSNTYVYMRRFEEAIARSIHRGARSAERRRFCDRPRHGPISNVW